MIRMMPWVAVMGLCLGAPEAMPAPPVEDQSPSVEKLIEQLGSKEFAERERATQMLRAKGVSALPALKKALSHPDREVCRRLQELIPPLEVAVALSPKRVTLDAEKRSLSAVLKEIEKQTGFKVDMDDFGDPSVDKIAMKEVPFWDALERIGRETGCVLRLPKPREELELKLRRREGRSPFVATEGAFRVELTKLHEDRDIDFTVNDSAMKPGCRNEELTATFCVLAEPRFLVLSIGTPRLELAVDEDEKPHRWHHATEQSNREQNVYRRLASRLDHTTELTLQRSTDKARFIKMLRGEVPVYVVVERKLVVVTESVYESKGTKFKISGETLEITRAEETDPGEFRIEIAIPDDNHRNASRWHERIYLEDANGNRLQATSYGGSSSGDKCFVQRGYHVGMDPKVGPPHKLIVEDWIALPHSIRFEFKEVPLP